MSYSTFSKEFSNTRTYLWECVKNFLNVNSKNEKNTLLEIGCGNGKNLVYAKELNYITSGFDICPEFVEECKSKNLNVFIDDMMTFKLNKKYNFILCIAALHHLKPEYHLDILVKLLDHLEENGKILLTLWSYEIYDVKKPRKLLLGDNDIPWKNRKGEIIGMRYYYVYNRELLDSLLTNLKEKIPNIHFQIHYEQQNWVVQISYSS